MRVNFFNLKIAYGMQWLKQIHTRTSATSGRMGSQIFKQII